MQPELPESPGTAAVAKPDIADGSLSSPLGKSATLMLAYLVLLWAVDLISAANDRSLVFDYGIIGRDPDRLTGILIAPFLHGDAGHLVANATAIYTLGLIAGLYGIGRFLGIFAFILLLGGLGLWLVAPSDAVTIGASGIVFGLFGYLATRGIFDRRPVDIVVSLGVAAAFGYTIAIGMLPQDGGISWQGHAAGFVAGVLAAWFFRRRRPKQYEPDPAEPTVSLPEA